MWGIRDERFKWNLIIKPKPSLREGLQAGSNLPRFDARLNDGIYINPFKNQVSNKSVGTHISLEAKFYE